MPSFSTMFATLSLVGLSAATASTSSSKRGIIHAGSNETFVPKVIPLAVRTPYVSTWVVPGDTTGVMPPPIFWDGSVMGWGNGIRVDTTTCWWMDVGANGATDVTYTGFQLTSTQSIFSFSCGAISFTATFLSPIEPANYTLQSLPWSYLALQAESTDGNAHDVVFYSDMTAQWVGTDLNQEVTWSTTFTDSLAYGTIQLENQYVYGEDNDFAQWGAATYATSATSGLTWQTGEWDTLRTEFVSNGVLTNTSDTNQPRTITDDIPTVAFAIDLGSITSMASPLVFAVGHERDPAIQFTALGCTSNCGRSIYARAVFPTVESQLDFFLSDYDRALTSANTLDAKIRSDAVNLVSEEYATIVELSARQALNGMEITIGTDDSGNYNTSDVMVFMKEISSDGNVNTVDVMFPNMPALLYLSPQMFHDLLRPGFLYYASGLYPNTYCGHDLGPHYPNATGYPSGNDEYMPVEESGNFIIMALAHYTATNDSSYLTEYYDLLKQWTEYLIEDGIFPGDQVSTDDFAGALANQTTLGLKSAVGIQAMSNISTIVGNAADAANYSSIAQQAIATVQQYAMDPSQQHLELAYGDNGTWSLIYNAFPDKLMNLSIIPESLLELQTNWYATVANEYGVPLDTRHTYTKTDWETWTSVVATTTTVRDLFLNGIALFLSSGSYSEPLPDWYDTVSGDSDGFADRPVVGGHFAHLALQALWGNTPSAAAIGDTDETEQPAPAARSLERHKRRLSSRLH